MSSAPVRAVKPFTKARKAGVGHTLATILSAVVALGSRAGASALGLLLSFMKKDTAFPFVDLTPANEVKARQYASHVKPPDMIGSFSPSEAIGTTLLYHVGFVIVSWSNQPPLPFFINQTKPHGLVPTHPHGFR